MKKTLCFFSMLFILMIVLYPFCSSVHSFEGETRDKSNYLSFNVDGGNMYFFDHVTRTVYVYTVRGEFRKAYKIDALGSKLSQVSSSQIRQSNK